MSGEAGSIGTLTAGGEPHPIGLDPLDPGFRRRLDRDALTGPLNAPVPETFVRVHVPARAASANGGPRRRRGLLFCTQNLM